MMAAIRTGQLKQEVTLIEKNPSLGEKLLLSGKGRCNLTNSCALDYFLSKFSKNGHFLRDAFKAFFNRDLMRFFEDRGLKLKVERQERVFPVTDKAESILEVLCKELRDNKVRILCNTELKDIILEAHKVKAALLRDGSILPADRIILATGGMSYSFTGSNGQGMRLAEQLGHSISPLRPGLVPLETLQRYNLSGLTLKNIRLKFCSGRQTLVSEIGELLFTNFGISGPLVLSLSAKITDWITRQQKIYLAIDLKPALSEEQLDNRLIREIQLHSRKTLKSMLKNLLPQRLVDVFLNIIKIQADKKVGLITKEERFGMVSLLKAFRLEITRARPIEEAMITCGGVSLKQINPRTMESRLIEGLYFSGEMIDVDADTGGFNLQAAISTGYLAGESAASR